MIEVDIDFVKGNTMIRVCASIAIQVQGGIFEHKEFKLATIF